MRLGVGPAHLHPRAGEHAAADRPHVLHAEVVIRIFRRVGAFLEVVLADAEVLGSVPVAEVAEAQRLIERQGVVDVGVDAHVVARCAEAQRFRSRVGAVGRADVRCLERVEPVDVEVERGLLRHERAVQVHIEVLQLLRSACRRKRAAPAQPSAAIAERGVVANRTEPRLGDDLHRRAARRVVLRRELVARDADGSNHRLGRQRRALEAVYLDDRAGPGHVLQLLAEDVGIVGQRLELLPREHGAECGLAIGGRLLLVALHCDCILQARDRQHHHLLVVAGTDPDLGQRARLESGKLGADGVAAGRQPGKVRDALGIGLHGRGRLPLGGGFGALDGDGRVGDDGAGLIDDRHLERAGACALSGDGRRGAEHHHQSQTHDDCDVPD